MKNKILLSIIIVFVSLTAFADSPVIKFDSIIQSDPRISFGKGILEQVAPTSGELNVTYEAVSIGGVGIPINVFLNYNSRGVHPFNDVTLGQGAYAHLSLNFAWDDNESIGSNVHGTFFNEFGMVSELSLISEGMIEDIIVAFVGLIPDPAGALIQGFLEQVFALIDVDFIDNTNAHTYLTQFTPQGCPIRGVIGGFSPCFSLNGYDMITNAKDQDGLYFFDAFSDALAAENEFKSPPDAISVLYSDGTTEPFTRNTFVTENQPTGYFEYVPANPSINSQLVWSGSQYIYITKDGTRYYITPKVKPYLNFQFINEGTFSSLKDLYSDNPKGDGTFVSFAASFADLTIYGFKYGLVTKVKDLYGHELNLEYCKYGLKRVTDSLGREVFLHYNTSNEVLRKDNPYRLESIQYESDGGTKYVEFDYPKREESGYKDYEYAPYTPEEVVISKPIQDSNRQSVMLTFEGGRTIDTGFLDIVKDFKDYFRHLVKIDYATGGYVEYEMAPIDPDFNNRYYYRDMDLTTQRVMKRKEYESAEADPAITRFKYNFITRDDWIVTGGLAYVPDSQSDSAASTLGTVDMGIFGSLVGGIYYTKVKEVRKGTITRFDPNGHRTEYEFKKNRYGHYNHYMASISFDFPDPIIDFMDFQVGYHPSAFNIVKITELPGDGSENIVTENDYYSVTDFILSFDLNLLDNLDYKLDNSGYLKATTVTRGILSYGIDYKYDIYGNTTDGVGRGALEGMNRFSEYKMDNVYCKVNGIRNLIDRQYSYQNFTGTFDSPGGDSKMLAIYHYDDDGIKRGELNRIVQCKGDDLAYSITEMDYYSSENDLLDDVRSYGLISSQTDPLGHTTSFSYQLIDNNYIEHNVTNALGITIRKRFSWNLGRLLSERDGLYYTTQYEYDDLGRVTKVIFVDGTDLDYIYNDTPGNLNAAVINAKEVENTYKYDGLGRLTEMIQDSGTGGYGYTLKNYYDLAGNLIQVEDSQERFTKLEYDRYRRLRKIIYPDNTELSTKYSYSGANNYTQTVTDAKGTLTSYTFDGFDRLIEVNEPEGASASYKYDDAGNLKEMEDPNDLITTYTYNTLNQLERTEYHDETTEEHGYNEAGNVISKTDGSGITTEYVYDVLHRLHRIKYTHPVGDIDYTINGIEYEYNANGNRTSIREFSDSDMPETALIGQTDYTYDNRNRLIGDARENQQISGDTIFANAYDYDDVGNLISTTYGSNTVNYFYDNLNRTTSLNLNGGSNIAEYGYKPMGTIEWIKYNGEMIKGSFDYDNRDRMLELLYKKQSDTVLLKHNFEYDPVGNRTRLTETDNVSGALGKVTAYVYDELYRLISVDHKERVSSGSHYDYDPAGNRTLMHQDNGTYTYTIAVDSNQLDEIISNEIGHTYLNYDDNGNLIGEKEYRGTDIGGDKNYEKQYTWDYENRLMKVEITRKNDDTTKYIVSFAYNGDGQRISKKVSTKKDDVVKVESQILYVRNSFGEVVEEHSLDLSSNIYHLTSSYIFGNGKRIMSISATDEKTYYLSDILGSNSLLTDEFGEATMLTKYDEFGNTYYEWSLTSNIDHQASSYKYTGKPLDKETGLYYYGARYYNPQWGRWVSRDIYTGRRSNHQTLNKYIYCINNPIKFIDSKGNKYEIVGSHEEKLAIFKAMVNYAKLYYESLSTDQPLADIIGFLLDPEKDYVLGFHKYCTNSSFLGSPSGDLGLIIFGTGVKGTPVSTMILEFSHEGVHLMQYAEGKSNYIGMKDDPLSWKISNNSLDLELPAHLNPLRAWELMPLQMKTEEMPMIDKMNMLTLAFYQFTPKRLTNWLKNRYELQWNTENPENDIIKWVKQDDKKEKLLKEKE